MMKHKNIHIITHLRVLLRKAFVIYLIAAFTFYVSPMPYAYANPQGGTVSSGTANISSAGNTLTINQSTDKAVVDWSSFNINANETTRFNQPSTSSMTLNRVNDINPSQILGTLSANGNIILLNPNGVLFGTNSRVDVNGIVASTASISNADFMAGNMHFTSGSSSPTASIINQGTITAADAGLVGLVAPNVTNSGIITARLGKVHLASGNSFTLDMYGDGLLEIGISDDVSSQVVRNTGTINAAGGIIKMTAAAGRTVVNSLIQVQGQLNAPSVAQRNGTIYIYAEGSNNTAKSGSSTVTVSGALDASGLGAGETGGSISVLGDNLAILSGATLNASGDIAGGTILVGGDYQGRGSAANAIRTVIEGEALISADAISSGNGGKVIAWADDRTDFNGKISARGGANGGDGGFVETSGKNILSVGGDVDASSALGEAGHWLLDPNNVIIQAAGVNKNVSGNPFTTTNDSAIVTTGSIQTALNSGTSVIIKTATAGTNKQLGDITVADSITKSAGGDATLTLQAAGSIIVNNGANIISTNNKLNIILNSDADASGAGAISITGAALNSNGGNITLGGGLNATGAAVGTSVYVAGISLSGAVLTSGAGNISLNGTGLTKKYVANLAGVSITNGSSIKSTSGNINITGTGGAGNGAGNYGVVVSGANSIIQSNGSGNVTITGAGGSGTGNNAGVYVGNGGSINLSSTSAGSMTVTGTAGGGSKYLQTYGVQVDGAGSSISSNATSGIGTVTITGSGLASNAAAYAGVAVTAGGLIFH